MLDLGPEGPRPGGSGRRGGTHRSYPTQVSGGVVLGAVRGGGCCRVGGLLIGFRRGRGIRIVVVDGRRIVVVVLVVVSRHKVGCWGEVLKLRRSSVFKCGDVPLENLR